MENFAQHAPLAFGALEPFPALRAAVDASLRRQAAQAAAALAHYQERPRLLAALEETLRDPRGGLVTLEGPPGSGVTSLIAALAARLPVALWLAAGTGAGGPAALYAQVVALHRPAVPLLDPTAATDPAALERLLAEAVATKGSEGPILLAIDDLYAPGQPARPGPTPLPADLPRGVTLLFGCVPGAPTPYPPVARLNLPDDDPDLVIAQSRALAALGCAPGHRWADILLNGAQGSFLYLRLAYAMLREGVADAADLPHGLDALLEAWWAGLGPVERRIAALLAAAGEPIPLGLAARLAGADPEPLLNSWEQLGLVDLTMTALAPAALPGEPHAMSEADAQRLSAHHQAFDAASLPPAAPALRCAFAHNAPAALLARIEPQALAAAHGDLAELGLAQAEQERAPRRGGQPGTRVPDGPEALYLYRQLARHLALAPRAQRDAALPQMVDRERLRTHERREGLGVALEDARWELRAAAVDGPELRLARAAIYAGATATRARALTPDAAAEAFVVGLERGGREPSLKRVLDVVERLPDGMDKAAILRRLGEICYGTRMRSSAMRLLSRALDLEASPTSRAWRDAREGLQEALAGAALALGAADTALAIAERIEHLERRAMVETEVVRYLLAVGDRARAQRLARAILHESMGAWARAEVGVALARAGDPRGAMLLEEIPLETVAAWAQIELACDEAGTDEEAALRRIEALPTQGQRDRGLARLARALAASGNDGAALAAAERMTAVEGRVAALIDLRLSLEGLVATLAIERATSDIGRVTGDDRAPLVADLAAALAALGRSERALELVESLAAGEERDRALARTAVALAQRGDHEQARDLIDTLGDEDERAWAYDEFARLLAVAGRWDEALSLCERIGGDDQRARAAADLAIERARAGDTTAALAMALALDLPAERARALTMVAPRLVAAGADDQAIGVAAHPDALVGAEARGRYLAAVAAALAEQGRTEAAARVVASMRRPADRARAGAALAHALAAESPPVARAVLGAALRAAAVGREETLRALELAAPALARLGGASLLDAVSLAVEEIDRW